MSLLAKSSGGAVTLAAGSPPRVLPASGEEVNVTSELRGLSNANYTALEAQRGGGAFSIRWSSAPEFDTHDLTVAEVDSAISDYATAAAASAVTATTQAGNASASAAAAAASAASLGPLATADEVIAAAGAHAANPAKRTTRYDLATAADNITSALADGTVIGQRKTLILDSISAAKTVVITPANKVGFTSVALAAFLDAIEFEWQAAGWKIVMGMGPIVIT